MSTNYYNLTHNPFDKTIPVKDAFVSEDHKEMINRLNYLKDTCGIGCCVGPPGSGKTFAFRCFSESLNQNLYECKYIPLSTVSIMEFYRQLCTTLGLEVSSRKSAMFNTIKDFLYSTKKEKRRTVIICLDECQYLSHPILCDLSMLMNFNYDSFSAYTLVLLGLPHFGNNLLKPPNESLRQRIVVHYSYTGMNNKETAEYIFSRIESAGGSRSIIDEAAVNSVAGACQGNPRIINSLMTSALKLGAQMERQSIDTDTILAASNAQALG